MGEDRVLSFISIYFYTNILGSDLHLLAAWKAVGVYAARCCCYYYYLLQLGFHSVAVILTLVQTKQMKIEYT